MSIYEDTFFMIYCCVLAGVFGAVLGSFLNCAAWRIAHGESFVKGRSHCTSCGHVLGFLDLIPVFSWIFLGGRCRYCKTKIYAQPIPSLNDITAIRLEKVLDEIDHIIKNEDLNRMTRIIEQKLNEEDYTAMDIAAAFLKQALGENDQNNDRGHMEDFGDTGAEAGMVRLFINIGKKQKVRPGDILGAVAGESGIPGKLVGTIDMYDKYKFVEVPRENAADVLRAMKNTKIKGKTINVEPANGR